MRYRRSFFDPAQGGVADPKTATVSFQAPDVPPYVYGEAIILAVNAALAIGRPLLVSGEPGSGKSSLARNVAAALGWRYYQLIVTSRTQARDLLWGFDALRRLADAQAGPEHLLDRPFYVEPRILWWAFNPDDAARRGLSDAKIAAQHRLTDPGLGPTDKGAVVLLDEIDKADPDVPNDLLEPLDQRAFRVEESDHPVSRTRDVFVLITTNGERELPPAFLRRCVGLTLDPPTKDWLVQVARRRFPKGDSALHEMVAAQMMELRGRARRRGLREPGTAEYLDALVACDQLGIDVESESWSQAETALLWKHPPGPKAEER